MPVLVILILMDIAVLGMVMYFVLNEKPKHHIAQHPFVTEAEEKARTWQIETVSDSEAAEAAQKTEEKSDQASSAES